MKKVELEDGQSADIVSENISKLKELFPDAFSENGVNFDTLRQLLGDASVLDEGEEKYGLNWHGKKKARQIALTPSTGTLLPCPDESVDWDTTQNLFIEGDNLEVLKLLQKSYANKVKLIYIDPPYNTGKEFIYPDKFQENLDTYLKYTGQVDDEGMKFSSNTETTGRKHTNWLNMMLPRLKLSQRFLSIDGVLLVSIDENECTNLKVICDEVFGSENFIAQLVWEKGRKNDAKLFSVGHEYMLVYAKNLGHLKERQTVWREPKEGSFELWEKYLELKAEHDENYDVMTQALRSWFKEIPATHPAKKLARYKNIDKYGPWRDADISWPGGGGPKYDVIHPETGKPCAVPDRGWRFSNPESMARKIKLGLVVFREDESNPPISKSHLQTIPEELEDNLVDEFLEEKADVGSQVMPSVIYKQSQVAIKYFNSLMGERVFTNPKDHKVLSRLINYICKEDSIIMDFFSGSCSTAEAVLEVNTESNMNHRFIMVQLPEKCDEKSEAFKLGFNTIPDIGKERIRRCSETYLNKKANLDAGFKVLKLSSSSIQVWSPDRTDLEESLLSHEEHLIEGRSEQDVLYELLLKRGVDLAVPVESREVSGKNIYSIGYGVLFACLDESIAKDQIEDIAQEIIAWYGELAPSSDTHVFFRDSAFRDDVSKTNMAAILEQNGITHVRSL